MSISKPVDVPDVYRNAPDSEEEGEELLDAWRRRTISYREKLLRWAALGDRATLDCLPGEGKAQGSFRLEAFRLLRNDAEDGVTPAGPLSPHEHLDPDTSTDDLRAYVRQEYASWATSRT